MLLSNEGETENHSNLISRTLTVQKKYVEVKKKIASHNYKIVPEIRLAGEWLIRAGFSHGDKLEVIVNHYELIIRNYR